jgi:hypothetical protein
VDVRRVWSVAAATLVTGLLAAVPLGPVTAGQPVPGLVRVLPDVLPNYFVDHPDTVNSAATLNSYLRFGADLTNHRYFEFDGNPCNATLHANAAEYDLETYRVVATGCVDRLAKGSKARNGAVLRFSASVVSGTGRGSTIAVDPVDRLFFIPANNGGALGDPAPQVAVFDEDTLQLVDVWDLPAAAPTRLGGLSWHGPSNQLVVMTDWAGQGRAHPNDGAVTVYGYDIRSTLHRKTAPAPAWTAGATACVGPIYAEFASLNAYRSANGASVYVPCEIGFAGPQSGHAGSFVLAPRDGVVTITLAARNSDGTACASGSLCAVGEAVAVAPATFQGFVFDPGSDRGYGLNNALDVGITAFGFDGRTGEFIGRTAIGDKKDLNAASIGVDAATGRLYGGGYSGLTLVDGRRTPVAAGASFPKLAGAPLRADIIAVPASRRHPYTRVLVPYQQCSGPNKDQNCYLTHVTVVADQFPVTVDPPESALDSSTYDGPLAGRQSSTTFNGDAAGYGMRLDWIGSANAVLGNLTANQSTFEGLGIPFTSGSRDLLLGYTQQVSLSDTSASGGATAVGDGQASTVQDFQASTNNAWPYPTATCGYPGIGHDDAQGFQNGNPQAPSHVDHSDATSVASAKVVCDIMRPVRQASGNAFHGGGSVNGPSIASIEVGPTESKADVYAPHEGSGVVSTATASVRGVRIDLGSAGLVTIGEISHTGWATATGRPGGARTVRPRPVLHDVAITVNGSRVDVCGDSCGPYQKVLDVINATFPSYLKIFAPQPDPVLLRGSKGGYTAGVQAPATARYGDIQFNQMNTEEASFVPALRLVVYNDGDASSRLVVDLAAIKIDAQQGVQLTPEFAPFDPQTPDAVAKARDFAAPPPNNGFKPGTEVRGESPQYAVPSARSVGAVVRAFQGFAFLFRKPAELLSMLALLVLLLTPLLLMARRRLWTTEVFAGDHFGTP